MSRFDILFGQNLIDLSFGGFGDKAQVKCDVSLDGQTLDTLLTEHDGTGYVLYDVQDLIPRANAIELPIFRNGYCLYNNFVQELLLKYYNDTKSQIEKKKIITHGGVMGYNWTGTEGQFLTKQPTMKKTNFRATEWLWFLMNFEDKVDGVVLKILVKTTGKRVIEKGITIPGYLTNLLLCVDVSAEFIAAQFGEIEKKWIDSYKVWLENDAGRISEVREYYLANSSAYDVEMIVLNSFGVWDPISVMAGQKNSKEFDLQYLESKRMVRLEAASWFDRYSFSITDLEQGWLSYLIEVCVARKIYLRDGSGLLAIVCTTKSLDDFYNTKVQDEATLEFRGERIERTVKI